MRLRAARLGENTLNGDGFGLGWYGKPDAPGVYKGTQPAWNDSNLKNLCAHIASHLFFAHIRATTGTAVQQSNCHPFRHGKWLFHHNGLIREFQRVKRDLALQVRPDLYAEIGGTTDSELMFYLARSFDLEDDPVEGMARMVGCVETACADHGIENGLQMSVSLSDGERLFAFRHSTEGASRSLFHSTSIDRRTKGIAVLAMAATFGISLALGVGPWVLITQAVVLSAVALFILTRPDGPGD